MPASLAGVASNVRKEIDRWKAAVSQAEEAEAASGSHACHGSSDSGFRATSAVPSALSRAACPPGRPP